MFEQDKEETVVIMRRWRQQPRSVIALFPYVIDGQGRGGGWLVSSYEHIGQHGGADLGIIPRLTRAANWDDPDVVALRRELEGAPFGYRLLPRRRVSYRLFLAACEAACANDRRLAAGLAAIVDAS